MRLIALAFALALPFAAHAQPSGGMVSCGSQFVGVGDSVGKMRRACGEPARTVALQTRFGGAAGERHEYDRTNGTVMFTVQGGRITRVDRV